MGNPSGDRLRTSAASAHVIILETFRSLLCTEDEGQVRYRVTVTRSEAARSWARHLQAIDPAEISEEETISVVESICSILSNKGGSIEKMERECREWNSTGLPCVLGGTEEAIQQTLACLQTWAAKVASMSPSLVSDATVAWMVPLVQTPETLFIRLAEAHVTNWFARDSHLDDDDIGTSFLFAHHALYQGRVLPFVQQNEQLSAYLAGRRGGGDASQVAATEESFVAVSKAFPHIKMTALSYVSIASSMLRENMEEPCLEQLKIAILISDNDVVTLEIYSRMAYIYIMFARWNLPMGEEAEMGSAGADDPIPEGSDEPGAEACSCGDGEETVGRNKSTRVQRYKQWTRKALEITSNASKIISSLPESAMEDRRVRTIVRFVWMYKAEAELFMRDFTNTVTYCRRVMETCRSRAEVPFRFDLVGHVADTKNWATFLDVVKVLTASIKDGAWSYLEQHMPQIHIAAKATGEIEYVLEQYEKAVTPGIDNVRGYEISLMIMWARFCRDVVGTVEAIPKAKALLNRAIDAKDSARYVAEASFRLSDILLEEFRRSTQSEKKAAVYSEMQDLVRRVGESMGAEFEPSQSQTVIPLAHMARKMDAVEFQRGLERTFQGCVAALTDETGWNDGMGLRVLARVLALVGLERDAQIAATCQLYALNMEIHRRENGWGSDSEHDDAEGGEGESGSDGEYGGTAQVNDVSADNPAGPVSSEPEKREDQSEEGGGGGEEGSVDGVVVDGNLVGSDRSVSCKGCDHLACEWVSGAFYLCYYCTESDLCQECFDERAEKIAGSPGDEWQMTCPDGHRHIKAPIHGWKGLTDGVFKIEDTEVSFEEWLTEVKEKKWPEAWERFWSEEQ